MTVVVLDGKQIKKVAKRLKVVRAKAGKLIGGKILVAYLPGEGLAVAMAADPEGEANDIRLLPEAVLRATGCASSSIIRARYFQPATR